MRFPIDAPIPITKATAIVALSARNARCDNYSISSFILIIRCRHNGSNKFMS